MASNENIDYCINGNWVRAFFSALPAWFRFAQCFRRYKDQKDTVHLVNAGKYSSTLIVVIFSFLNVYFNLHFAYSEVGSTPARTLSISGLKSRVLKSTFLK